MAYLVYADITDRVARSFDEEIVTSYFTEVDNEINDISEQQGIYSTSEIDTDYKGTGRIHYKLIRFGIAYLCYRLFIDRAGVNDNDTDPSLEKYYVKANYYNNEQNKLRGQITKEMFTDAVNTSSDRTAYSAVMIRS